MYAQIKKHSELGTETLGRKAQLLPRYERVVSNTKKMNAGFITTKEVKSANGVQTHIYNKAGGHIRTISLLADKTCWTLSVTTLDGKGK